MKTKYLFHRANYAAMKKEILDVDWVGLFHNRDIQSQWDNFISIYNNLMVKYLPKIEYNLLKMQKHDIPLPPDAILLRKSKDTAWSKYMDTRKKKHHTIYCKIHNKFKAKVKYSRKCYENNINFKLKDNPKLFWRYIKSKTSNMENISQLYTDPANTNSELTSDNFTKSQILNNYFSSVFIMEPAFDNEAIPTLIDKDTSPPKLSLDIEQVEALLKDINPNKSCGPDSVHPRIISELYQELALPFYLIFSSSLSECKIPYQWKQAKVVAIFKKGNKKVAGNYRPISLTSIICKLLEKLVRNHLMSFMLTNILICITQFGFVEKRSTALQLLHVLYEWSESLEQG